MAVLIYVLADLSILLAIGGLVQYAHTKHIGLLLSSAVSVVFSALAVVLVQWWPLVVGFGLNWGLRLLGLDTGWRRSGAYNFAAADRHPATRAAGG